MAISRVSDEDIETLRRLALRQYGGAQGQQVRELPYVTLVDRVHDELRVLREVADAAENVTIMPTSECIDVLVAALKKAGL